MSKYVKKIMSLGISILILISIFGGSVAFAAPSDGDFSGGSGVYSDPYLISSESDFLNISKCTDQVTHFKLTKDLDFNSMTVTPIDGFMGSFNGDNHTISNVTIYTPAVDNVGLFSYSDSSYFTDGIFMNLYLKNLTITGKNNVGGLLGGRTTLNPNKYDYSVYNVHIEDSKITAVGDYAGSIAANSGGANMGVSKTSYIVNSTVENCSVTANNYAGGLIGYLFRGQISQSSVSNTTVKANTNYSGGFAGSAGDSILSSFAKNVTVSSGTNMSGGFIGYVYFNNNNVTLEDCYVEDGNVTALNEAGGFAGRIYKDYNSGTSPTFNCYADINTTVTDRYAGGFVGYLQRDYISNCYSLGTVKANESVGGFAGYVSGNSINNSYSATAVSLNKTNPVTTEMIGGFFGETYVNTYTDNSGRINNCFFENSSLTTDGFFSNGTVYTFPATGRNSNDLKNKATFAAWNIKDQPSSKSLESWYILEDGSSYPQLSPFYDNKNVILVQNEAELNQIGTDYVSGSGSSKQYWTTYADYQLADNITMTSNFEPIGSEEAPFKGTFDGAGKTITGLKIVDGTYSGSSMFGYVNDSVIKNIILKNVDISHNTKSASSLITKSYRSQIIDCKVEGGAIKSSGQSAGLAAAFYQGFITNSSSKDLVVTGAGTSGLVYSIVCGLISDCKAENVQATGTGNTNGGLVGYMGNTLIANSSTSGKVQGLDETGGLLGRGDVLKWDYVDNCTSSAETIGEDNTGGLIGDMGYPLSNYKNHTIVKSSASGDVSGLMGVGGLVGYSASTIENCSATGSVYASNQKAGGLVGWSYSIIKNCTATEGTVKADDLQAGGLVGDCLGTVYDSSANKVVESDRMVGGLAGSSGSNFINCSAAGDVKGREYVGGLVGNITSASTVKNSSATGNIYPAVGGNSTGGLIGRSVGSIENSFATGNVIGEGSNAGGLVGYFVSAGADKSVLNCFSTGDVQITGDNAGGLIGGFEARMNGKIKESYATGSVKVGDINAGGLIGTIVSGAGTCTIENSMALNEYITANDDVGLIAGSIHLLPTKVFVTNFYAWDNTTNENDVDYQDDASFTITTVSREDVWNTFPTVTDDPWKVLTQNQWIVNTYVDHMLPIPEWVVDLPVKADASHLRPASSTTPPSGGDGKGDAVIVGPPDSGIGSKTGMGSGSGNVIESVGPESGFAGLLEEIQAQILIVLLYSLAIAVFVYRRKAETDEEN